GRAPRVGLRGGAALERGSDRGALPRHPAGGRLPGLARPFGEAHALRAARRRGGRRGADRDVRDPPRGERQRALLPPCPVALLRGRPHRPRPGRRLRGAQGGHGRGGRSLAAAEPRLRARGRLVRRLLLAVLAALVVVAPAAALTKAGHDPQKRLNARDQAKARSLLLRQADLGSGWTSTAAPATRGGNLSCAGFDP